MTYIISVFIAVNTLTIGPELAMQMSFGALQVSLFHLSIFTGDLTCYIFVNFFKKTA